MILHYNRQDLDDVASLLRRDNFRDANDYAVGLADRDGNHIFLRVSIPLIVGF